MKKNKEIVVKSKIKKSTASKIFDTCNAIFMILFCITILFPLWDVLVRSVSLPSEISVTRLNLWPKNPTMAALKHCFSTRNIFNAFWMSLARTVIGTLVHLVIVSLAAYAMTKDELPFIKVIQAFFVIPMFIGAGTIPVYLNIRELGLVNNFWVYILPMSFSLYNCIIMRNYFYTIDKGMEESAAIDGASKLRTFISIIIPLSKPVIATVALWQMVGQWNAWFDNMMYTLQEEKLMTMQYLLRIMLDSVANQFSSSSGLSVVEAGSGMEITGENVKAAVTVIVVTPIVAVYPFIQKYFVKGIMVGAVKG